jgi:hypothetical protein
LQKQQKNTVTVRGTSTFTRQIFGCTGPYRVTASRALRHSLFTNNVGRLDVYKKLALALSCVYAQTPAFSNRKNAYVQLSFASRSTAVSGIVGFTLSVHARTGWPPKRMVKVKLLMLTS